MRSIDEVRTVGALVEAGLNDCAIARQTGIPRRTIADWRNARRWERRPVHRERRRRRPARPVVHALPPEYVYLLGMYLGDGYIVRVAKAGYRLIVAMDGAYPRIIAECARAIEAIAPGAPAYVQTRKNSGCVWVIKHWRLWPDLFPQHGPGAKHTRPIVLKAWQQHLVRRHPELFLRGLLHSDGCRSMNTIRHGERVYAYPRYNFTNASADIRRLFCDIATCLGSNGAS
jgi:hypothetical protein